MQPEQNSFNLYPKFNNEKGSKFSGADYIKVMSNFFQIQLNKQNKIIYQHSIIFEPNLPQDSTKLSDRIIASVKKDLYEQIGLICYKGKMLWGNKKLDKPFIHNVTIDVKEQKQKYQIMIKPNTSITVEEFIAQDQYNLGRFSQVLNINVKNVLKNIGFKQLDRGKYYLDQEFNQDKIQNSGLSVWRGFQVNIVNLKNQLFIRADVCSRILRTQSLLQTMKRTNRINEKQFINTMLQHQSIITRYGNHKIYSIQSIDYSMTPRSLFPEYHQKQKPTFLQYYKQHYQITIKDQNQPLIQVKIKNQQKQQIIYLIPELVVLTGLTQEQKGDFQLMKNIDQKTKLRVQQRVKQTNKIIRLLNKQNQKQLMFTIQEKAQKFPGIALLAPMLKTKNGSIMPEKGSFRLKDIQDPVQLKNYYFVYTVRGDRDYDDVDATIKALKDSSKAFGIRVNNPLQIDIKLQKNQRLNAKDWIQQIQIQIKKTKNKPQFIILYFNKDQMKDKRLYEQIKNHLIHKLQIGSQVITKRTLSNGAKGAMSKASKILLQINDKMGHPLYKVQKQHPYFNKNSVAMGGIAVSSGSKGIFVSLVGTRNNQMTQHYSDFHKINMKQVIPQAILSSFMLNWMKTYYDTQKKSLPSTIVLLREGLNQKQAQKILNDELKIFTDAFEKIATKSKLPTWKPKLIYILVNQKNNTRIYDFDGNSFLSNPLPGTIIGSQISKDGSYEFLMSSAVVTQGTCNMIQYKIAYDSSNQQVPHEALKTIIYEQCYNYPNWTGSIRFPAPLQKANKLAKFISNLGEDKIDKNNPLKDVDYYI